MTRHHLRKHFSRPSYTKCSKRTLIWNNPIYYFRSPLFYQFFFWAFYHSSLAPTPELGGCRPPTGIRSLNPLEVLLLNTSVLLASGVSTIWPHHSLTEGNWKHILQGLFITVALGVYFTFLQASEYYKTSFTISDGVYRSTFFIATGFHRLHVNYWLFLIVCFLHQLKYNFTSNHHFSFKATAWYWHSVDGVWLFLYVSIYWWGSYSFSIK